MLAQNWQITNIHLQNQNSTSIRNIIQFIHTSLRYKMARTTETARVTWCEHDKHHVWLVKLPTPPQCSTVFARVEIGLARVRPGMKKDAKFLNRLLKKNG